MVQQDLLLYLLRGGITKTLKIDQSNIIPINIIDAKENDPESISLYWDSYSNIVSISAVHGIEGIYDDRFGIYIGSNTENYADIEYTIENPEGAHLNLAYYEDYIKDDRKEFHFTFQYQSVEDNDYCFIKFYNPNEPSQILRIKVIFYIQ